MDRYLVPLKYLVNLNSHLNFKFKGKIKFIAVTWVQPPLLNDLINGKTE